MVSEERSKPLYWGISNKIWQDKTSPQVCLLVFTIPNIKAIRRISTSQRILPVSKIIFLSGQYPRLTRLPRAYLPFRYSLVLSISSSSSGEGFRGGM